MWRFVAGLTKFSHYEGHVDCSMFHIRKINAKLCFTEFLPQCLFEAQSARCFSSILKTSTTSTSVYLSHPTALDAYALGYCIANFPIGVPWDVEICYGDHHSFTCGLSTKLPCEGVITRLHIFQGHIVLTDLWSYPLGDISTLHLVPQNRLTNTDLVHLSELIPHLPCLEKLDISSNDEIVTDVQQDGLLKVLHQLYNVTSLDLIGVSSAKYSHDHFTALKHLIDPSSGKLKHLGLDDIDVTDDECLNLLSAPSSLKSLALLTNKLPSHALHLKNNSHLTTLEIHSIPLNPDTDVSALIDLVNHNGTLEELSVGWFEVSEDIDPLRRLVRALQGNCNLQRIEMIWNSREDEVTTELKELASLDPRIKYHYAIVE